MATTNISAFFSQIEKDFIKLSKEAPQSAAKRAQEDIKQKADKFIDEYYDSYKPKFYKRRHDKALHKLIEKVYVESESSNGITIEFGIRYDDKDIGIDWKIPADKIITSEKDLLANKLKDMPDE